MNSDIVNPMPASAPAPASCRQEYAAGFSAMPSFTASHDARMNPAGLPMASPQMMAAISMPVAAEHFGRDDHAGIRQREDRQHQVTRTRRDVAQQPVRGRFEAIVDGVELAQRGLGRPVAELLAAVAGFRREDGFGLQRQRLVVRRLARRDERG